MNRKNKRTRSKSQVLAFFFLFMFCRKRKRTGSVLINETDCEETRKENSRNDVTAKENTKNSSEEPKFQEKNDKNVTKELSIQSSPSVSSKRTVSSSSSKLISSRNALKAWNRISPRRKRIAFSSPSKCTSLNSHVTIELTPIKSSENSERQFATNGAEDQLPLLQDFKENLGPITCNKNREIPPSNPRKVRRSKSLSDQHPPTCSPRKRSNSSKPTSAVFRHSSPKKPINNERHRSAENINKQKNPNPFSESDHLCENSTKLKESKEILSAGKSLEKITHSRIESRNNSNFSKRFSAVYQERENRKKTINQRYTPRKKRRPYSSVELNGESNYVMLNPISSPRKAFIRNQNYSSPDSVEPKTSNFEKFTPEKIAIHPSKSLDSLHPLHKQSIQDESTNDFSTLQLHDDSLFSSPGVDYRARVNEVLTQLRRSLRKQEHADQSNIESESSFSSGFPIKKSKSVEPITAFDQHYGQNVYIDGHQAVSGNRSRSRVKYIARKYNMFTSSENVSGFHPGFYTEQQNPSNWGYGDYVYLSQKPHLISPEKPTFDGTYPARCAPVSSHSKVSNFPSEQRRLCKNDANNSDDEHVIMTSQTGKFYHLNLIVQNSNDRKNGNEYNRLKQKELNGYESNNTTSPRVFYSLDV